MLASALNALLFLIMALIVLHFSSDEPHHNDRPR